jgi:acyl-CoA reductase-like NAD-dependent aldehyde dehydrogenase
MSNDVPGVPLISIAGSIAGQVCIITCHLPRLATLLATLRLQDNGKPLFWSKAADIPLAVSHLRYFAGWADKISGKTIQVDGPFFGRVPFFC